VFNRLAMVCVLMLAGAVACAPVSTRAPTTAPPEPTCGPLGPSADPEAIARVGALYARPENVTEFLGNLQLAYDQELFIQPGFYDDANLEKFFAGSSVQWGPPRPLRAPPNTARDIVISSDAPAFPRLTVSIERACLPKYRSASPQHPKIYALAYNARLELRVAAVPGFTVGATREVFGTRNWGGLVLDQLNDEFGGPDRPAPHTYKGTLDYEDEQREQRPDAAAWRNAVTFVVAPNLNDSGLEAARLNEPDRIERIEVWQAGK
jgi:hypothetical protein